MESRKYKSVKPDSFMLLPELYHLWKIEREAGDHYSFNLKSFSLKKKGNLVLSDIHVAITFSSHLEIDDA